MRTLLLLVAAILFPVVSRSADPAAEKPVDTKPGMRFQSYDIDRRNPRKITVGLAMPNTRSVFVEVGDMIPGTKLRIEQFKRKEEPGSRGTVADVSEIVIVDTD